MDYFITLKEETFKFVKEIIIGRGSPFDALLEHREIARSHARFHLKGKHLYLTDLGSNSGTYINGKKLESKKDYPVKPSDIISIANIPLKLSRKRPKKIKAFKVKRLTSAKKNLTKPILIFLTITTPLAIHSSFDNTKDLLPIIVSLTVFLICILISFTYYFLTIRKHKKIHEIYIGRTGLTLHFESSNMSINFDNIESAKIYKNIISLKAHGRTLVVHRIKNLAGLTKIINKRAKRKVIISNDQGEFYLLLIILFAQVYSHLFLNAKIVNYVYFSAYAGAILLFCHQISKRDLRRIVGKKRTSSLYFIIVSSIVIYSINYYFTKMG